MEPLFTASMPEYYDRCLGLPLFDPFAADLVQRLPARPDGDVLEVACGTGVVTRRLRARLDPGVRIVATDISASMLAYAREKASDARNIDWQEADACKLPFAEGAFAAVVCAFGLMFIPDTAAAFREARRILKPGGIFCFAVWDAIEENPHGLAVTRVIESVLPDPEMAFRTPYSMASFGRLKDLLQASRFVEQSMESKRLPLGNVSARTLATGQIRGTPRSAIIEKQGVALDTVIDKLAALLTAQGGADPYRGHAQAIVALARAT